MSTIEEDIKALRIQQGHIKGRVTRLKTFFASDTNRLKTQELKKRLEALEPVLTDYHNVHLQIQNIDESTANEEHLFQFENDYFEIVGKIQDFLENQTNAPVTTGNNSFIQSALPDINIPKFGGSYIDWLSFRDTFTNLIHENKNLGHIQKFHYLKGSLEGDAHETIKHLSPSNDNYIAAWQLLHEQFENKRIITKHHIQGLFSLPTIHYKDYKSLKILINSVQSHLKSLQSLGRPVDQYDDILVHLIQSKFDNGTIAAWEECLKREIPTMKQLMDFLKKRCETWESIESNKKVIDNKANKNHMEKFNRIGSYVTCNYTSTQKCPFCKKGHTINNCSEFLKLTIDQRISQIKDAKLCVNCLRYGHRVAQCRSSVNCKMCNKRHNSLLHFEHNDESINVENNQVNSDIVAPSASNHSQIHTGILLATAMVKVLDKHKKPIQLRALLDSGSQSNFLTQDAVKKLGIINLQQINLPIVGITNNSSIVKSATKISLQSNYSDFQTDISCLVVPNITSNLPFATIKQLSNIPVHITLADPLYYQSRPIDILIGSELFWDLICNEQLKLHKRGPILQETKLGFIISGNIVGTNHQQNSPICLHAIAASNCFEMDSVEFEENFTQQDTLPNSQEICEKHFTDNYRRDKSGRFIVKLPFANPQPSLGSTHNRALGLFYKLEQKLAKDPVLKREYQKFMDEYLRLEHMAEAVPDKSGFWVPHHGVSKDSSTTALRVVFNASFKSDNGMSLNDNLLSGPNLNQNLFDILLRFRIHNVVITADLKKMYRQILIDEEDRKYQQIFYRSEPNQPIKTYSLNTVTYGFTSSSFLATRCLHELANIEQNNYPTSHKVIFNDFYVDDLLTGSDSIQEANKLLTDIGEIVGKGGFELHKIKSNRSDVLCNSNVLGKVSLDKQVNAKTLGVSWDSQTDTINYSINLNNSKNVTKRSILSTISRIFDPLGLVNPVIVNAKIIMQKIWSAQLNWDQPLPEDLNSMWVDFISGFHNLKEITINRHVLPNETVENFELHAFSDSSKLAFGACVYLKCITACKTHTNLLCAKSRVSPLKERTIPQLELCAALLSAELVSKVKKALPINISKICYWSDSQVVLAWIHQTDNSKTKPFVHNRIKKIQNLTQISHWHYVNTKQNPADIISRGTTPNKLKQSALWWYGPDLLKGDPCTTNDEQVDSIIEDLIDTKTNCCLSTSKRTYECSELLARLSSLQKVIRVVAWILRFAHNTKLKSNKSNGTLSCMELQHAHDIVIKSVQQEAFTNDINSMKKHGHVAETSKIESLNPFLDNEGLLRVGGRLKHSSLSYEQKHQLLLPKDHKLTELIVTKSHMECLHGGCQATLAIIRQKYWIISGRNKVRQIIFKCFTCYKQNPRPLTQLMSDLPKDRVTPNSPFSVVGVDYAGPVVIKNGHGRTKKTIKCYIAIFVCFSTRAVHIELVCECTSLAFLNTLKRFIARRGKPNIIYSDNGTNFVGANNELRHISNLVKSQDFGNSVINHLSNQDIQWKFIPPRAPHMGGLWEAAVKSTKNHLKRVLTCVTLNFEELYTVLVQIEACLNSRPITPLSSDPNDLRSLTPGHFLIGRPLIATPQPDMTTITNNRLTRFQLLTQIQQSFWKRWSAEYLNQLQQRHKWSKEIDNQPGPGDLVIIKEDNCPPRYWPMARILELHHGSDGRCRIVSVKTARGVIKRPLTKICAVPLN